MKTSESIKEISIALSKAQGQMSNPALSKINPHFKSRYADLPEVINTVREIFSQNGLALSQSVSPQDGSWVMITKLMHVSGEWIEGMIPLLYTTERGNPMQSLGSAITYARRYALAALCNIAADDDDDGNAAAQKKRAEAPRQPENPIDDSLIDLLVTDINVVNTLEGFGELKKQAASFKENMSTEQISRVSKAIKEASARING
jgi:hypothetical protein